MKNQRLSMIRVQKYNNGNKIPLLYIGERLSFYTDDFLCISPNLYEHDPKKLEQIAKKTKAEFEELELKYL